jgi:hypothetical protein
MVSDAAKEVESMIGYAQELSTAMNTMSKAMLENMDKSKSWTVMSRFTSGSGFWKIQNKVRGVVSSFLILNETMEAGAERIAEYNKLLGTYNKIRKKVPKEVSPEALKRTAEFKDKSAIYEKAFGAEGEAELIKDLTRQNVNANKLLDKMEGKLALQLKYSKMTFTERMKDRRERLETWFATKKQAVFALKDRLKRPSMKQIRAFVKLGVQLFAKVMLYIMAFTVIAAILMLFLRRALKWFNEFAKKSKLWETGAKFLSAIWEIMSGIFDVMVGIWRGDFIMVLGAFWNKILPGIAKVLYHGFMFSIKLLGALFTGLIGGFVSAIIGLGEQIHGWIKERTPKAWAGRQWSKAKSVNFRSMRSRGFRSGAGGITAGENILVGEAGPEIVTLPMGARVHSNSDSRRMGGNNISVHVNGRVGASDMEIKDIANKVAREINLRMNRTGSVAGRF